MSSAISLMTARVVLAILEIENPNVLGDQAADRIEG